MLWLVIPFFISEIRGCEKLIVIHLNKQPRADSKDNKGVAEGRGSVLVCHRLTVFRLQLLVDTSRHVLSSVRA